MAVQRTLIFFYEASSLDFHLCFGTLREQTALDNSKNKLKFKTAKSRANKYKSYS
jgi:hypothetical protein